MATKAQGGLRGELLRDRVQGLRDTDGAKTGYSDGRLVCDGSGLVDLASLHEGAGEPDEVQHGIEAGWVLAGGGRTTRVFARTALTAGEQQKGRSGRWIPRVLLGCGPGAVVEGVRLSR